MMPSRVSSSADSDALPAADLIFVLAGRESRKLCALQVFREGLAPALLLSVGRYEIRRFALLPLPQPFDLLSLAAPLAPPLRHFFVSFTPGGVSAERVTLQRFGTLSEVQALSAWLRRHPHIRRILVISDKVHLPRVRLCCKKLLPPSIQLAFLPAPEGTAPAGMPVRARASSLRYFLVEMAKLFVYRFVFAWRASATHARR